MLKASFGAFFVLIPAEKGVPVSQELRICSELNTRCSVMIQL